MEEYPPRAAGKNSNCVSVSEADVTMTGVPLCTVVFASNEKGVLPLSLALWSLLKKAAPSTVYDVRILSEGISEASQQRLKEIGAAVSARHTVSFINMEPILREQVRDEYARYLPKSTWSRIFVPELMPEVHRALYVDIDVLFCDDCSELFTLDMQGSAVGCVYETPSSPDSFFNETFDIPVSYPGYFNSGVLLMDLDLFRSENLSAQILEAAAKYSDKLKAQDQDALNAALYDRCFRLHPRWNWNDGNTRRFSKCNARARMWRAFEPREVVEASLFPGILHFIGPHKPWRYNHRIMRGVYEEAIRESGLPGFLPIPGWNFRTWLNRILYAPMYARTLRRIRKLAQKWGIDRAPAAGTWGRASDCARRGWPPAR